MASSTTPRDAISVAWLVVTMSVAALWYATHLLVGQRLSDYTLGIATLAEWNVTWLAIKDWRRLS